MKKTLRKIVIGTGLIFLALTSGIIGMRIEKYHQETKEMEKEHISTIAVVNMDEGITTEDEQMNYASQLMGFPNDHFTVTGLSDAKSGIENGLYAAYIVIPETFSEAVTSIEKEPRKVTLGYQYNVHLDEEAELQAVNDVNAFVNFLNSNIAYMYMDAIMAEFHRVQDDSSTILSNDNAELTLLENVDAMQLIATAKPVEEIAVDDDVAPVELSAYTAENDALLESMMSNYADASQKGRDDYASIQATNVMVGTARDNFLSTYHSVVEDSMSGQKELLETGRDSLADAVGAYNGNTNVKRDSVHSIVSDILDEQVEQNKKEAVQSKKDSLADLQKAWTDTYETIKTDADNNLQVQLGNVDNNLQVQLENSASSTDKPIEDMVVDAYTKGLYDALNILNDDITQWNGEQDITVNDVQGIITNYQNAKSLQDDEEVCVQQIATLKGNLKNQLKKIHIDWENLPTTLPTIPEDMKLEESTCLTKVDGKKITDMEDKILALFNMELDTEEVNQVLQTCFVDALSEENSKQWGRLSEAEQQLTQSMVDYENSLMNYNPLRYVENANLNTYLDNIKTNAGEMLNAVEQNNSEYQLYATDMYAAATMHTTMLKGSLDEANQQTATNVENCMNELVLSRENVNSENIRMLEGFTNSLKYTRVESQGNAEVYDSIINPVVSQNNGQTVADTEEPVLEKDNFTKVWLVVVLGIGIVICLAEVSVNIYRQYKNSGRERRDVF